MKLTEWTVSTTGYQTLTGRDGQEGLFKSDILPLCNSCVSLRQVCLAYQASLDTEMVRLTPIYMQSALSHYFNDLNTPEKLELDATLATGVLLCSLSVSGLLKQTLNPDANIYRSTPYTSGRLS
jgi:hypothetical protein